MKLISPSFEIWKQDSDIEGIYKQIELAGRTCYKSEDKITEDSAKGFVERMIKSGHGAMLEHGTVYLKVPTSIVRHGFITGNNWKCLMDNPYTKMTHDNSYIYFTTNYRVIVEHDLDGVLKYICEPTEHHEKRVTVRFIADIHFYKDITRHRVFSWAIESTRFCNYLKKKFEISVSFMEPTWIKEKDIPELEEDCKVIESIYFKWINKGYQAQHAAYFLPQGTKAEVVMTGFVSDYNYFFDLRARGTTGQPHPDVKALAEPLMQEFINRGFIKSPI